MGPTDLVELLGLHVLGVRDGPVDEVLGGHPGAGVAAACIEWKDKDA
jgi:hypothetical protein